MADSNDQQSPPAAVPASPVGQSPQGSGTVPTQSPVQITFVPSAADKVEAVVESGAKSVLKNLWSKYGILFLLVGLALIVAKFSNVIIDLLGWSSKKDLQKAEATDAGLKAQADTANAQADALVKKANDLPNQEDTVDADWDKKQ